MHRQKIMHTQKIIHTQKNNAHTKILRIQNFQVQKFWTHKNFRAQKFLAHKNFQVHRINKHKFAHKTCIFKIAIIRHRLLFKFI